MFRNMLAFLSLILSTTALGGLSIAFPPSHNLIMRHWSRGLLFLLGVKLRVAGTRNIKSRGSHIIIMNHESALDIPIIMAAVPLRSRFMAKKELFRIPLFGWVINLARHIPIDRANPRRAIVAINRISKNLIHQRLSIVVSPEGTRSYDGKIAPFKKGAFRLAEKYNLPILPVTILGARHCVPNKRLSIKPGIVEVYINPPVTITDYHSLNDCIDALRQKMIRQKEAYELRKRKALLA